ncbi:MAG: hypothetical protein M0000_06395 [Actinomycetota bacterium]|nr:hypothetical protein [Actinomycetota bacterium]
MRCPFCNAFELTDEQLQGHFELIHPDHLAAMRRRHEETRSDDGGDFVLSAFIGAETHSAFLGGLIGGDPVGGLVGDLLGGDSGSSGGDLGGSGGDSGSSGGFDGGGGDFSGGGASSDW